MPQTINLQSTQTTTIPSDVYSMQITLWGAGGGGESINTIFGTSTSGGAGGNTSFLNLIAYGGSGGQNKIGGNGGSFADLGNWETTYGVTVSGSTGNSGSVNTGGVGLNNIGAGGDGSPQEATFVASSYHEFDNINNIHTFTSTSAGISIDYINPTAADGLPCGIVSGYKAYGISFNVPFDNANYSITMNSFCSQSAGGSTEGPFSYAGESDKTVNGFTSYFCRQGSNGYIRCFTLTVVGQRSAFEGAGGGSGGKLTTEAIPRDQLISAGYNPGQSYTAIVGSGGTTGTRGSAGNIGRISITYIIQANIILYANGQDNEIAIIYGESVDLTWNTFGDVDTTAIDNVLVPNNGGPITVTPSVSTTYTGVASGLGGSDSDTVFVRVYQLPLLDITVPNNANYGEKVTLEYSFSYADISVTITPQYKYRNANNDGFDTVSGNDISITPISSSAEFDVPGSVVVGSIELDIPYNSDGPFEVTYFVTAVGSGGTETKSITTTIFIDLSPDNISIPESEAMPNQEPIYSPNLNDQANTKLTIIDVDIPVEIKSDKPIKVSLDDGNTWIDVREKA